jgi:hypothetical protein
LKFWREAVEGEELSLEMTLARKKESSEIRSRGQKRFIRTWQKKKKKKKQQQQWCHPFSNVRFRWSL